MTYYKDKSKSIYQHPFFLGAVVGLVLILGMMVGYYFAKTTSPTPAPPTQAPTPPTNQEPTPSKTTEIDKPETMDSEQALDQIQSVLNDSTALSANARIILQSQKNSPVVWEMSQQDPTKGTITSRPSTATDPAQSPQTLPPPSPQEQPSSAYVGNQSVLHPEDIPANEYAGISHLQNPAPPTIQPKITIQSMDKNDEGKPIKSLEIE